MGRPKGTKPWKVTVGGTVTTEQASQLEQIAIAEQRTVSQLVGFAVEEWLRAYQEKSVKPRPS